VKKLGWLLLGSFWLISAPFLKIPQLIFSCKLITPFKIIIWTPRELLLHLRHHNYRRQTVHCRRSKASSNKAISSTHQLFLFSSSHAPQRTVTYSSHTPPSRPTPRYYTHLPLFSVPPPPPHQVVAFCSIASSSRHINSHLLSPSPPRVQSIYHRLITHTTLSSNSTILHTPTAI
jgi:hypothetical protein